MNNTIFVEYPEKSFSNHFTCLNLISNKNFFLLIVFNVLKFIKYIILFVYKLSIDFENYGINIFFYKQILSEYLRLKLKNFKSNIKNKSSINTIFILTK